MAQLEAAGRGQFGVTLSRDASWLELSHALRMRFRT
jgi:hypothetical protein